MDIQPEENQTTKPISDDQELAKVLAGISKDTNNLGFEETPAPATPAAPADDADSAQSDMAMSPTPAEPVAALSDGAPATPQPTMPAEPSFNFDQSMTPAMPISNNLDGIRKEALTELRPLVDKLNLAPEEKFDIYLLLLRSTDDTALIAPAHEAAKNIADESKRAEALLDVIKEIDFLSSPAVTPAA